MFLRLLPTISALLLGYSSLLVAKEVTAAQSEQHIQVLAASCAACHGNNGNSEGVTPLIAGLSAEYFTHRMLAFRNGTANATVMHRHAKGLTEQEIGQLAQYFAKQPRIISHLPPHD